MNRLFGLYPTKKAPTPRSEWSKDNSGDGFLFGLCISANGWKYLLQKEVLVGLHAHSMLVLAADLIEEPVQSVVVAFGILHQTVPEDVHLLQAQSWQKQRTVTILSLQTSYSHFDIVTKIFGWRYLPTMWWKSSFKHLLVLTWQKSI